MSGRTLSRFHRFKVILRRSPLPSTFALGPVQFSSRARALRSARGGGSGILGTTMREDTIEPGERRSGRDDAVAVVRRLRGGGHVAYFAGGCVRDAMLGLEPKDYDVATDAPPARVRELFTHTQAVGAAFGVILVRHGNSVIEVATFRTDGRYADGRRPEAVTFTTAEEDAKRRDFTINGMFLDPIENKVIDYVGGQADLEARVLRAIGEANRRFDEDHLRLLRAVRFAARFSLSIDPATEAAIRAHAEHLKRISPERIAEELRIMLTPASRRRAWELLWALGLMPVIFRHLPERNDSPNAQRANVQRAILPALAEGAAAPFGLALAALALCYRAARRDWVSELLEPAEVRRTVQALRAGLKISNEEADLVAESTQLSALLGDAPPTVATMKRFLAQRYSRESRQMLRAIARAEASHATRVAWLDERFEQFLQGDVAPPPLLTGDDLTAAGWKPGPAFKRVLDGVYDAQLEDRVNTKEEALAMAETMRS